MEESEYFHEPEGVYCFLGISLKPEDPVPTLSGSLDDWDVYASCYVTDTEIIMSDYKLPV